MGREDRNVCGCVPAALHRPVCKEGFEDAAETGIGRSCVRPDNVDCDRPAAGSERPEEYESPGYHGAHAAATGAAVRHSQVHLGALGRLAWDALLVWLVLRFLGSHLGIGWIDYFEREDQAASWD